MLHTSVQKYLLTILTSFWIGLIRFCSVRLSLRDGESTFAGKVMFDGLKMAILAILALLKVEPCRGNKNSKKLT